MNMVLRHSQINCFQAYFRERSNVSMVQNELQPCHFNEEKAHQSFRLLRGYNASRSGLCLQGTQNSDYQGNNVQTFLNQLSLMTPSSQEHFCQRHYIVPFAALAKPHFSTAQEPFRATMAPSHFSFYIHIVAQQGFPGIGYSWVGIGAVSQEIPHSQAVAPSSVRVAEPMYYAESQDLPPASILREVTTCSCQVGCLTFFFFFCLRKVNKQKLVSVVQPQRFQASRRFFLGGPVLLLARDIVICELEGLEKDEKELAPIGSFFLPIKSSSSPERHKQNPSTHKILTREGRRMSFLYFGLSLQLSRNETFLL